LEGAEGGVYDLSGYEERWVGGSWEYGKVDKIS